MARKVAPVEVTFSRELNTARAVTRSLAILMAVAVFTLLGSTMVAAGPAAALSYLIAGLVCALTLLCYIELLLHGGREGGAYTLLREATRGPVAFLSGWAVLLGGVLLCAALALAFGTSASALFEALLGEPLPQTIIAALIIVVVAAYNVTGGWSHRRARDIVTWLAVTTLLLLCLLCLPCIREANYRPFSPYGPFGIQAGLALLMIGFLALESVPLTISEVREPRQTIPRALFATVGVGILLFVVVALVAGGVLTGAVLGQPGLLVATMAEQCLGGSGLLLLLISVVLLPLALNSTLLLVVRQAQAMDRDGLLPGLLRRRTSRFRTPYVLLMVVGVVAAAISLLGDLELIAKVGSFCALFVMSMIALGDIIRFRGVEEPSGSRLPLHPLIPALALVVNVFLMPIVGITPLMAGVIWLALGTGIYVVYARGKYIAGQEGVVVFRSTREPTESKYRVLVPLAPGERQSQLIKLAVALAGDEGGEVLPLRVVTLPAQVPLREGARMADGIESVFSWSLGREDTGSVSLTPITRVARSVSQGIIDSAAEEDCDLMLLSWEGYTETKGRIMGPILDPVIENAPCDVILVKGDALSGVKTILLPTSGGPHASIAAKVALRLARLHGARVTVMYVCREGATAEERQHGMEMIDQTVRGLPTDDLVQAKVITAPGVVGGILKEAQEHDLVLLGASEEGFFDRVLFGTIPERIARKSPVPVMIVRERAPLPQFWLRRAWHAAYRLLPTLEAEERSTVYRQIREDARADIDYFVMITLAAIIATLGLLLNSAAVIIGGMLVAPLMSPVIGIALAVAMGNARLLRDAAESTIKGIFLAVVVALFLASIQPVVDPTEEVLARIAPNLLDLLVALASGAAGAYAVSRKDVSAALPGVAIAAALVPPLGVIGVGLAARQFAVAGGGVLLFTTNLVAITFAGAMVFLLLGFRPARGVREREIQVRRGLVISVVLLLVVSLPLALIFSRAVHTSRQREVIDRVLAEELDKLEDVSLVSFEIDYEGETIALTVIVYAAQDIEKATVQHMENVVTDGVGQEVSLRLIVIPVTETTVP